jgi:DnaK suppressor protein
MTPEDRQELKKRMQEKILELESHIKSLRESSRPVEPDNAIGRITRMDAISAKGISESSLRSAEDESARLQVALKRIGSEDFGVCADCGEDIPIGRLMLLPASMMCVDCAGNR